MRYLITGSSGFIGKNLTKYLQDRGEDTSYIDYPMDLCCWIPSMPADVVVHLAAETDVRKSVKLPDNTIIRNIRSTISALTIARENNARFVFASSCGAPQSLSPYSASKMACEAICKAYQNSYGIPLSILRFSNVYGPHSIHKSSVIAKFIRRILNGMSVEIYGDGNQTRDFIYVEDVCEAIYHNHSSMANIAYGKSISINDLVTLLPYSHVEYKKKKPGEINKIDIDSDIVPNTTLGEGLEKTFKWFKENYKI